MVNLDFFQTICSILGSIPISILYLKDILAHIAISFSKACSPYPWITTISRSSARFESVWTHLNPLEAISTHESQNSSLFEPKRQFWWKISELFENYLCNEANNQTWKKKNWKLYPKRYVLQFDIHIYNGNWKTFFQSEIFRLTDVCPVACGYLPKIMVKSLLTNSRGLQGVAVRQDRVANLVERSFG